VESEKSLVPLKTGLGEKSTPSVWMTTSTFCSAFRIVSGSSASPDILSRAAFWIGMFAAERARARTLWPDRSAVLTVSRPIPRLAPMTRTFGIGLYPLITASKPNLLKVRELCPSRCPILSPCWALFGLDFCLLLKSGLGCFAAFHMAELRLARLFQFGLRLFQLGFLLAKIGYRTASTPTGRFALAYHLDNLQVGHLSEDSPAAGRQGSGLLPEQCSRPNDS
jgi:hypothetical protein